MRKIFLTLIGVLAFTFSVVSQEQKLEEVDVNVFAYTENTLEDTVHQTGFYENVNGELLRHGVWKLYINGVLRTEAIYENDKLKTLIVDGIEYSAEDLIILRKENGDDVVLND
jgi:hypothetical protein